MTDIILFSNVIRISSFELVASSEKIINELEVPDFVINDVTNIKEYEGYSIAAGTAGLSKIRFDSI